MHDMHPLTRIVREFGWTGRRVIKELGLGNHENNWNHMKKAFENGSVSLKRIREVAELLGITPGALVDLVEAEMEKEKEKHKTKLNNLEVLKRMAKADPEVAFAYYMTLKERGLITPEIEEWANQHL